MVGRAAEGNPWTLREIIDGVTDTLSPRRGGRGSHILALILRAMERELEERRAVGFLERSLRLGKIPAPRWLSPPLRAGARAARVDRGGRPRTTADGRAGGGQGISASRGLAARLRRRRRALADLGVRRRLMRVASSLNRLARRDGTVQLTEKPRSSSGGEVDHQPRPSASCARSFLVRSRGSREGRPRRPAGQPAHPRGAPRSAGAPCQGARRRAAGRPRCSRETRSRRGACCPGAPEEGPFPPRRRGRSWTPRRWGIDRPGIALAVRVREPGSGNRAGPFRVQPLGDRTSRSADRLVLVLNLVPLVAWPADLMNASAGRRQHPLLPPGLADVAHPDLVRAGRNREPATRSSPYAMRCGGHSRRCSRLAGCRGRPRPVRASTWMTVPPRPTGSSPANRSCARNATFGGGRNELGSNVTRGIAAGVGGSPRPAQSANS